MPGPSRRETLALGALGLAALARPGSSAWRVRARTVEELARAIRSTPRDAVFDVATEAIRAGVDRGGFLGAIFLAGVQDVRPRPHGILHCVMEVASNRELGDPLPGHEAWLPAFFNLDDFKRSQARDADEDGDWTLPPPPDVSFDSAEEARRELVEAMSAWDAERADRAVVGLLPYYTAAEAHDELREVFLPYGLRCYAFIGHKAIYVAQVERELRRQGWSLYEPALRSLVRTVLVDRNTTDFEQARELASSFPERWRDGAPQADASLELLAALRTCSPSDSQELVVNALREGLGPESIWDGVRLLGAELFLRRPGTTAAGGRNALLPVHGVTVPNALAHMYRTTERDEIRRLALLQAAAWTVRMRDDLGRMVGLSMEGPGIDVLGDDSASAPDLGALFADPTAGRACRWLESNPTFRARYADRLRRSLFRRGVEHHQHKYAAAMLEDVQSVASPWRSRLLAVGIEYLATPSEPETEVYARSLRALREAGIR